MELDAQFPKLTYSSMVGQQQNIFELQPVEASKWVTHRKVAPNELNSAIVTVHLLRPAKYRIKYG